MRLPPRRMRRSPSTSSGSPRCRRNGRDLLLHINGIVDEIAFGSVVLVLHDGKVIQVETSEKIRLR